MLIISKLREQSRDYGLPIWKLPDVLLVFSAVVNIVTMIASYWWLSHKAEDPREAVPFVAIEAALIMLIGNIVVESAKRVVFINQLKKEFVDIVSHQMRSPLATIKWYMEMLTSDGDVALTKKQKEYIEVVVDANGKMLNLVNDLLNMANIEKNRNDFHMERFDMMEVVSDTVRNQKIFANSKELKVIWKKVRLRSAWVVADRIKTKVVLDNLLSNAIKYTDREGAVEIVLTKGDGRLVCEVKDTGIGIRDEEREKIFQKFFRSQDSRTIDVQGTGLGLYISKVLLEGMGGEIWYKSKIGKGTSFFFTLPLANSK